MAHVIIAFVLCWQPNEILTKVNVTESLSFG